MNDVEFRKLLGERGYPEPEVREYEPGLDNDMHTHEFSAMLLVTRGEFTLALEDGPKSFGPGEWCELTAGTRHAERAGPDGATALLARRH